MKTALLIIVLAVLLGAAVAIAAPYMPWTPGPRASIHMWIAMGLGVGFTFLLGAGLMALAFHSNARGYDDAAKHDD